MRCSAPLMSLALIAALAIAATPPASAIDQMAGVTMTMVPAEADSGGKMGLNVTLHNHNDRSLTITSLTVQIYNGNMMFSSSSENKMYHINPENGLVPANGSREFAVPGNAPDYLGMCSVTVTIAGILDGDENASIGLFTSSIFLNPNVGGFVLAGVLLLIVPVAIIVVVVVLAVLYFSKKSGPAPAYGLRCPRCGEVMPPGSTHCTRCGKRD